MSWFVKPVVLEKVNTGAKLLKINLNYQQKILPFNKTHIGFGAQKIINDEICKDAIQLSEIQIFKEKCIIFLTVLIGKLFERSSLSYASVTSRYERKTKPLL